MHCGKEGHLASDCYSLTPAERAEYKEWQSVRKSDASSVSSNDSSRSGGSNSSAESDSGGSASGSREVRGKKATQRNKPRQGVFGHLNFAFGVSNDRPTSFG